MSTESTTTSFDEFVKIVLKWKGKGLRFHIRIVEGELKFWLSEIPEEIRDEFHALYRSVIPEIKKRFSQEEKTEVAIEFSGGDLFSALQKANDEIGIDYKLMEELNSKEKQFDMPWTWKPCEGTQVPCEKDGICYGDYMWNAGATSKCKKQNIRAIRQCPYIGKLDKWWYEKCLGIGVEFKVVDGRMTAMFGEETYWQYSSRRKKEIAEEVEHVLRSKKPIPDNGRTGNEEEDYYFPAEENDESVPHLEEHMEEDEEDSVPWEDGVQVERKDIPSTFNPLRDFD